MFELSKQFRFDAAHTLEREIDAEPSRRIHGHSYRAEVTVRGDADQASGMVVDLGLLTQLLSETKDDLNHRLLDEVPDLGPATLENLSKWIWERLRQNFPLLFRIAVFRDSDGDSCAYFGPGSISIGSIDSAQRTETMRNLTHERDTWRDAYLAMFGTYRWAAPDPFEREKI